jgi:hypothetical protein
MTLGNAQVCAAQTNPPLPPEEIARQISSYIAAHPHSIIMETGRVLFDLSRAKHSIDATHGRCVLHLWNSDHDALRTVSGLTERNGTLRLATLRLGQKRPLTWELAAADLDADGINPDTATVNSRRTASRNTAHNSARQASRLSDRKNLLRRVQRVIELQFDGWHAEGFRAAMDLERSFGPAYVRGVMTSGQQAWAVIAVGASESQSTIDGILTLGILWLAHCREHAGGRRLFTGLRLILPTGSAALTLSRLAWLSPRIAQWELYELSDTTDELTLRDSADNGNLATRIIHASTIGFAQERFATAHSRVMDLLPEAMRTQVETRVEHAAEMGFHLHGLEFARARMGTSSRSFQQIVEITFGAGASETQLTAENESQLREIVAQLFRSRHATGSQRDPLYRLQPERWLESVLRHNLAQLEKSIAPQLDSTHVYSQVPAFAAGDRGMLDLLSITNDGRLAVLELKASEDLHLALQGLDYWIRVRWHHAQPANAATGLSEFQRHGYFPGVQLSPLPPRLYLVAPALRVHPATEIVLRYFKPEIEWTLVALDERWRKDVRVVWRKRSSAAH